MEIYLKIDKWLKWTKTAIKVYRMFQKFGPIVNCILRKAFKSGCQRKPGKMLKMSTEGGQQNKFILTS